jgi:arylsulfatase A-like enzyme
VSGGGSPNARRRAPWLAAALAAGALGVFALACADRPPERIVLVVADTLRRDYVSPYGSQRETPQIAALAARGQVLPNVLAPFHQTSMSMGALFTGRTPSIESGEPGLLPRWNGSTWCGMSRFADPEEPRGVCLPRSLATLGERMREAGYWTIGIASNMFLFDPAGFSRGFDDWVEVGQPANGRVFGPDPQHAVLRSWKHVDAALGEALERRRSDRFFLYVHYMDAHDYGRSVDDYASGVAQVDHAVGLLLSRLERAGLLEGAVVVLSSDHGERLEERHALEGQEGHRGNPAFQEVLRVPLVIAPAVVDDPERLTRFHDLYYVLQEIAGAHPERPAELAPDELYLGERRYQTYLKGRWKSTRPRSGAHFHLFDLLEDPHERRNVAAAHPQVVEAHRRRMDELARSLTGGPVRERALSPSDEERLRALGYLE